jgi:hypothetical protein
MIKSDAQLSDAQVKTPRDVVNIFWRLLRERRPKRGTVLDLGAGDGRFAKPGEYRAYHGIEIDITKSRGVKLPKNAAIEEGCAFKHQVRGYDACIGNPPYVRHHDIEPKWKEKTLTDLSRALGVSLDCRFNLYLYFMCLGILHSSEKGLLAVVVPHEWFGRPSSRPLRNYIKEQLWNVDIYRFTYPVFDGVLTTASITFIDKATRSGRWRHYDILAGCKGEACIHKSTPKVLPYESRGKIWALRGLSTGTQRVFTLTDGERIHNGLKLSDVVPCVTSLASFPSDISVLSEAAFRKHFVESGQKCWLIKSHRSTISKSLGAYLNAVPANVRSTWTCKSRPTWSRFQMPPVPDVLVSSGFVSFGPKTVVNKVGAIAVGTVYGVHGLAKTKRESVRNFIASIDFEQQVVPHAKTLRKIEVRQLNAVLNRYSGRLTGDASISR